MCIHLSKCVCVCVCLCVCVCVCIYITHLQIVEDTRNTHEQHTCKETHVYLYHNPCTHTHMSGRSCCLVCMDVCMCVHVYHSVYVYVCIYIIHLHIDVTAACTMHVHNVHANKQYIHLYMYNNSYKHITHVHMDTVCLY